MKKVYPMRLNGFTQLQSEISSLQYEKEEKARKAQWRLHYLGRVVTGFTLIEFLITSAIVTVVTLVIVSFQRSLFTVTHFLEQSISIQRDAEALLRGIVAELRAASPSDTGGFPLEIVASSSLAFYTNIDFDAARERVQYFLNGTTMMRSVVEPVGAPAVYATTSGAVETLSAVLRNVRASSTPNFTYYDRNYAGTTTPLAQPVATSDVRFVLITFIVDEFPDRLPPPITVSSQVNVRNLKDNY